MIGFTTVQRGRVLRVAPRRLLLRRANPEPLATERNTANTAPLLRSLLRLPSDYGALCWVLILWGQPFFWWLYGLLFVANLVIVLAALPVWFRSKPKAIKVINFARFFYRARCKPVTRRSRGATHPFWR